LILKSSKPDEPEHEIPFQPPSECLIDPLETMYRHDSYNAGLVKASIEFQTERLFRHVFALK
jgi:hypothetical protein